MLNLRYILRLVTAFVVRFKILIFLSIIVGIIISFGVRFLLPEIIGGSTKKIGVTGRFTTTTLPASILRQISRGLTKLDESGNVEPDLATSWETPDKGKTWIFKLNDRVLWQDGKKFTSQSINYQFSDVSIENPDPTTIIFKLQNPYSAFPVIVSRPVFKTGLLGVGDWQVKKLSLAGTYVDRISLENKSRDRIIYRFYPSEERAVLGFELGDVDSIEDILNPTPIDTWKNAKIIKSLNTGEYVSIFFNTQNSFLSDKNVRQALNYAIDKENLGGLRAISPISLDSWAYNPQVKPYNFDQAKAKNIIDDYKKSSKASVVEINLTTTPILLKQAEKIANNWQAAGLKVNLQVMANIPSDYQALLAIFDIPEDPDQYSVWHSTQIATNITHYQDPRIDKLLEDGRSNINLEERRKIYLDFQRYLVEDSPAIFLYYPTIYNVSRH